MSKYTNYENVSKTYDNIRYATGVETIVSIVSGLLRMKPEEVNLLDAGCGTGNYSQGFLENGIGSITMIDGSTGMLQKAKEKIKGYESKVKDLKLHLLPSLPFPDASFDVVSLIEVAQHLDTYHLEKEAFNRDHTSVLDKDPRIIYPNLSVMINEAFRVLKPHGVFVIDHCFTSNCDASWLQLSPIALALYKQAMIPEIELIKMLRGEGFQNVFIVQRPGSSITRQGMFSDPECALDPNFRKNCSEWTHVEATGELPGVLELLNKKKQEGVLNEFVKDLSKYHAVVGETSLLFAQKNPLSPGTQL